MLLTEYNTSNKIRNETDFGVISIKIKWILFLTVVTRLPKVAIP